MGGRGEGTGGFPRQKKGGNSVRKGVGTYQEGCVNLLGGTRTHDLAVCGSGSDYCATPHELSPMAHTYDTYTRMHTPAHTHTHAPTHLHTRGQLSTHSHTRSPGASRRHRHPQVDGVRGLGGNVCPNPLLMYVCEACAGQLPLHTPAISMFEPENGVQGGKTGGRRPYHRLPRQKLCLMVSSDPNLVSRTQGAVFDQTGFRTQNILMPSPATLIPSPARRRLIRRGNWLRVLSAGPGTLLRSPGPPPT